MSALIPYFISKVMNFILCTNVRSRVINENRKTRNGKKSKAIEVNQLMNRLLY
jgi:hypothetical protein